MKIGLPPDILKLMLVTQANKPGSNETEFLALINGSQTLSDEATTPFLLQNDDSSSIHELPTAISAEVREEVKTVTSSLNDSLLNEKTAVLNDIANIQSPHDEGLRSETVIAPHIQLAFATNKLSYLHSSNDINLSSSVSLTSATVAPIQRPEKHIQPSMQIQTVLSTEQELNAAYAKAALELGDLDHSQKNIQHTKIQHLLSELSPFLKKSILITKKEDQFVVYVRDYQSGDVQLDNELELLRANLSQQSKKPVQFVINGRGQVSNTVNTMGDVDHAS